MCLQDGVNRVAIVIAFMIINEVLFAIPSLAILIEQNGMVCIVLVPRYLKRCLAFLEIRHVISFNKA